MPRYDYECLSCSHVFELKQSFSAEPVADCLKCGSRSRRKFHAVPVIYKGSGFYTTDYARSSLRANGTGSDSSESSESKDEKPAAKAEKKDGPSQAAPRASKTPAARFPAAPAPGTSTLESPAPTGSGSLCFH